MIIPTRSGLCEHDKSNIGHTISCAAPWSIALGTDAQFSTVLEGSRPETNGAGWTQAVTIHWYAAHKELVLVHHTFWACETADQTSELGTNKGINHRAASVTSFQIRTT